ncbi:hypothetical protein TNCV_2308721 [Trichonephila clavipes]|nr:hypothetical protein TNCV_2308721 [Trichonephila clavipes]
MSDDRIFHCFHRQLLKKQVHSTSPGMLLADEELDAVQSNLDDVADRPVVSTRAVAHSISVKHQTVCGV